MCVGRVFGCHPLASYIDNLSVLEVIYIYVGRALGKYDPACYISGANIHSDMSSMSCSAREEGIVAYRRCRTCAGESRPLVFIGAGCGRAFVGKEYSEGGKD